MCYVAIASYAFTSMFVGIKLLFPLLKQILIIEKATITINKISQFEMMMDSIVAIWLHCYC